ncbi:MAG: carboxypeptidase-like regulatory domain-containing protein, partial [Bacteroidota bacterium]
MTKGSYIVKPWVLALCCYVIGCLPLRANGMVQDQPLLTVLSALEAAYNIHFSFNPEELSAVTVQFELRNTEGVEQAIHRLLQPTPFQYETFGHKFYVIYSKSKAGKKDLRKLKRHWSEINKLEKRGHLSLNRKGNAPLDEAQKEATHLKGAKWNEGKIIDAVTKEGLIGANILVENEQAGTASDAYGNFGFYTPKAPPYILRISYTGYKDKLVQVTKNNQYDLNIAMSARGVLLNQVVVGASRHSEHFVEAPVTVEKLDMEALQSSSAEGMIESLANLKGVQVVKGSIAGAVVNTRGFANMNNLRFLMHLDGMDVTSPAFGVYSNMGGVSLLDVQSIEIVPSSSSALYGANAFNGILLMQSKDPFIHQGLSAFLKSGVTEHSVSGVNAYNNFGVRYAKSFNKKLAIKVDYEGLLTKDWIAHDLSERDTDINPATPAAKQPNLVTPNQPNYDAVNIHGDRDAEAFTKVIRTGQQMTTSNGQTFAWPHANVHRTGYTEAELFNSQVSNHRLNLGLYYKINEDWQLSYLYKSSLQDLILRHTTNYPFYDFNLTHHKVELRGKGLTARWYHSQERAKNTWSGSYLAASIQTQLLNNEDWGQRFVDAYAGEALGVTKNNIKSARSFADQGMAPVGSVAWENARRASISSPTVFNPNGVIGAKLAENSAFWQTDLLYNFAEHLPKDSWKIQIGSNLRRYNVDSDGAFFNDNRLLINSAAGKSIGYAGNISLLEASVFGQVSNHFFQQKLQVSLVGRMNYHTNFKLNFTPQLAVVYTPVGDKHHHFRGSFTTGVRNPGLQEQYINFLISPNHVILGGTMDNLENYYDPFL